MLVELTLAAAASLPLPAQARHIEVNDHGRALIAHVTTNPDAGNIREIDFTFPHSLRIIAAYTPRMHAIGNFTADALHVSYHVPGKGIR